jgi:metal dependent phosphohydrolase
VEKERMLMKKDDLELIDYAIYFATKAHTGQKRKSEPEVDMIFHPFTVGMILQRAGANTNCVIAGILHDVVEDTKYTLEDIKNEFGPEIANIVDEVSENKSLKWKERKIEAINKIKTASIEGKLVECVDKISNLETLYALYKEEGEKVWESFNKPKEEQKWYYTNMYDAVLMNTTEENKLFERYKKILDKLF